MQGRQEYHVFVRFISKLTPYALGTTTEYRGGVWHNGVIAVPPRPSVSFTDRMGIQRANDFDVEVAEGPAGALRALAVSRDLEGVIATVECVMRNTSPTGTVAETVQTFAMTIVGAKSTKDRVVLRLTDLEPDKLGAVYPSQLWTADDFSAIPDRDAGKPVPYPVGTALKLPAPRLVADVSNSEWTYGACGGDPITYPITAYATFPSGTITVTGNLGDVLTVGQAILISGGTTADGRYTITSVTPGASTVIGVSPNPGAGNPVGGSLRLMPHPLTVYRNDRIVPPAEYTVEHLYNPGTIANGDFAAGINSWNQWFWNGATYVALNPGTGSSIGVSSGQCSVTCVSPSGSRAYVQQYGVTSGQFAGIKGGLIAVQITVDASGADAMISPEGPPSAVYRCPAGATTTVILRSAIAGSGMSISIAPWNFTGTTRFTDVRFVPINATLLRFAREQVDFNGGLYAIASDVLSAQSRNAADELARLLVAAGVTVDAGTFATAAAAATANRMLVDCDYGRAGQRRIRLIIDDLLTVLRAGLYRVSSGAYAIWQDTAKFLAGTYDVSAGDSVQVDEFDGPGRPKKVALSFRPSSREPDELQSTIERTVAGGQLGDDAALSLTCLRDPEAADRLLCYRALRRQYNATCVATIYREAFSLGQLIRITSPLHWSGQRDWMVRSIERMPNASRLDLIEYDAAVYTYTPSPRLARAGENAYQPDYSQTAPAAPTALTITAGAAALDRSGGGSTRITAQCVPPAVNWAQVWFAVVHNVTAELIMAQGSYTGFGSTYGVTIPGLRPGEVYQLRAWAVNAFGVQGALQSTFSATAIGGGAAVTTFTAPGYATLPPNVSSCVAAQGTGLLINVNWPAVSMSTDALAEYILERRTSTIGAWTEIWRGRTLSYIDRDLLYTYVCAYRVRARDRWGNTSSAYATSGNVVVSRTIYGGATGSGDIVGNTVHTDNRTGVSTVTSLMSFSGGASSGAVTYSHGLGKTPVATVVGSGDVSMIFTIGAVNASTVTVWGFYWGGVTEVASGPGSHDHLYKQRSGNATVTTNVW